MRQALVRVLSATALLSACLMGQSTGRISGIVTDELGAPVPDAYVTYLRTPYTDKDTAPIGDGQYTTKTGAFTFSNLIAASYGFCVQTPPERGFVQLCDWTVTPPRATLNAGESATVNIRIEHGARIEMRFEDPSSLLPTPEDKQSGSYVTIGVRSADRRLHSAQLRSRNASGQDYWVIVPLKQPVQVHLSGSNHVFQDDTGLALAKNGGDVQVQLDAATATRRLQFRVSAAKAP